MALKLKELADCYQQLQSRLQNYATLKSKLDNKGEEVSYLF
jgi:chaperonin cofactor prefoldin